MLLYNDYEILIVSSHRENLSAEIYYKNIMIAEITEVGTNKITLVAKQVMEFEYSELMDVFEKASIHLKGENL